MIEELLEILSFRYPLTETEVGEMSTLKVNGMTFSVKAYKAEGLGHVSVMGATGFLGFMKMDTLMINPLEADLPIYSYDRIYAMGHDTLIVELYDTLLGECPTGAMEAVKASYAFLPERDPGTHWYDSIKLSCSIAKKSKKKQTNALDALAKEHMKAYSDMVARPADVAAKREKALAYVDGLLRHGGPSTDVFKQALGSEKTENLFKTVLFGLS